MYRCTCWLCLLHLQTSCLFTRHICLYFILHSGDVYWIEHSSAKSECYYNTYLWKLTAKWSQDGRNLPLWYYDDWMEYWTYPTTWWLHTQWAHTVSTHHIRNRVKLIFKSSYLITGQPQLEYSLQDEIIGDILPTQTSVVRVDHSNLLDSSDEHSVNTSGISDEPAVLLAEVDRPTDTPEQKSFWVSTYIM